MTPDELLQLIRTCNAHQVMTEIRHQSKLVELGMGETYDAVVKFYKNASQRKKTP